MEISSGTLYRSLVGNTDFSFLFEGVLNNVSGQSSFGFSGSNNVLNLFNFSNGKIFDTNQNFVWSYNPRNPVTISGNIGSGYINYFINEFPICLYTPHENNYYDYFYISSQNTNIDFNLQIKSLLPDYNIRFPIKHRFGRNITGYISNLSQPYEKTFKVYSGDITNTNNLYSLNNNLLQNKIYGGLSGLLTLNFEPNIGIEYVPSINSILTLYTNFGTINKELNFIFDQAPIYFLDFVTGFTGIITDNLNTQYLYSFTLETIFPNNEPFTFLLFPISGNTGQIIFDNYQATGFASGFLNGFVHGFDYITGYISGFGTSPERNYYNNFATGRFEQQITQIFQYATGNVDYHYTLNFTGGSGTGASPVGTRITGFGITSGNLSGFIFGSRNLSVDKNGFITGYWNSSENRSIGSIKISKNIFYTGEYNIFYPQFLWEASNVVHNEFSGYSDKIYLISGSQNGIILDVDSGVKKINQRIFSNQTSALLLKNITPQNVSALSQIGSVFASENSGLSPEIFIETTGRSSALRNSYWYTTRNTGFLGFTFNNSDPNYIVNYYKINISYNSVLYPFRFRLEGSNDFTNWTVIHSIENPNFYTTDTKIYSGNIPNSQFYQHIRLNIISGKPWNHKDYNDLNPEKLIIKELIFYKGLNITRPVIGSDLVPNLSGYDFSLTGTVIYSADSSPNFAWKAFDKQKTSGFASILSGFNNETNRVENYLGFRLKPPIQQFPNIITGYRIQFEPNYVPTFLAIEAKENQNSNYIEYYRKTSNIQLIESGNIYIPTGSRYFRFIFSDFSETRITQFFPAMGNHDYDVDEYGTDYLRFFKQLNNLTNNSSQSRKYYEVKIGPCHFFILDSDPVTGGISRCGLVSEGAGKGFSINDTANEYYIETQKQWFNNAIQNSQSPWKFVIFHHPPYTSESTHYGYHKLSHEYGWKLNLANAVFNGHSHNYERFEKYHDNSQSPVYYIVNGAGGINLRTFGNPLPDSKSRIIEYGWTKIEIFENGYKTAFVRQFDNTELDVNTFGNLEGKFLYKFAIIADYGNNGLGFNTTPPDYFNPNNNFYTHWVSRSIARESGINAIFTAGDNSYPYSSFELLDLNCGQFYCKNIGVYYSGAFCK